MSRRFPLEFNNHGKSILLDRKKIISALRILISVVLIGWLIWMADEAQLVERLAGADYRYLLLMALVVNLDRFLMATKWNMLLRAKGIILSWGAAISAYYRASFFNIFLPTVGSDSYRIVEVSRLTGRSDEIIASVAIERFFGIIATAIMSLISFVSFVAFIDNDQSWATVIQLLVLLSGLTVILTVSMSSQVQAFIFQMLPASESKIVKKIRSIFDAYQQYANQRKTLAIFLGLSVIEQLFQAFSTYFISRALGLDIPFVYFVIFIPLVMMIIRLPISFDGYGVRETLYIYFFGLVAVSRTDAFLLGFLSTILWRIASAPLMIYYFWVNKVDEVTLPAEPTP